MHVIFIIRRNVVNDKDIAINELTSKMQDPYERGKKVTSMFPWMY